MPLPLAPVAAACVFGVLIAYGMHRPRRERIAKPSRAGPEAPSNRSRTGPYLKFFNEIDEGLWFYLDGIDLAPVPGTHPRYNTAYDLAHSYLTERQPSETIAQLEARRQARDKQALIDWLDHSDPNTSYLLIRGSLYDGFAAIWPAALFRSSARPDMKRNELVLLRKSPAAAPHVRPRAAAGLTRPGTDSASIVSFRRRAGHIDRVDTSDRRSRMVQEK